MYLELRLCPALHCKEGLSIDEVLEAVIYGFSAGIEQSGDRLEGGIIVCIMRSMPLRHAREMIDLAERFLDRGVIGAFFFPVKLGPLRRKLRGEPPILGGLQAQCGERTAAPSVCATPRAQGL